MAGQDARAPAAVRAGRNSPYPRSVREEQQLLTRRRLLDASLRVFEESGYHGASVEEIVSAAGVTRSTFYLHFKNKSEVLQALTDAGRPGVAELYAELDASVVAGDGDIRPAVRRWLERAMDWYSVPEKKIVAAVWQELSVGVDSQVVRGISVDDYLPRYLDQWPAQERDAARTRVILLSHLLSRAVLLSRRGSLPGDENDLVETLADLWATGLAPPAERGQGVSHS